MDRGSSLGIHSRNTRNGCMVRIVRGSGLSAFWAIGQLTLGPLLRVQRADDKWTPDETNYLFALLAEYDLRFLIVADRYAYLPKLTRTGVADATISSSSRKKITAAVVASGMRRSARGTMFGGVGGEEDYDSRDGTPAEGEGGFPSMGEVKRRSIEVCVPCAVAPLTTWRADRRLLEFVGDQGSILYDLSATDPKSACKGRTGARTCIEGV